MTVQISKNFSLNEFVDSVVARNLKIDNTPSQEAIVNITLLVQNILQPIRDKYGKAIFVNSGYRSQKLNDKVGGALESQHLTGEAADITAGNPTENKKLFNLIMSSNIPFDQLIDEYNYQWIHVSFSKVKNRRQILYIKN